MVARQWGPLGGGGGATGPSLCACSASATYSILVIFSASVRGGSGCNGPMRGATLSKLAARALIALWSLPCSLATRPTI